MVKDNIKRANKKPGEPGAKPSPSLFARFRPIVSASIILLTAFYVYVSPAYVWRVGETFNVANVEMPPMVPYEDKLSPNEDLTRAVLLAKGELYAPECVAFSQNGDLYTGLSSGYLVKVHKDGQVEKIVLMGEGASSEYCEKVKKGDEKCGRPLGMRFKSNTSLLYIADTYLGLFKVDVATKSKELILSSKDKRFGDIAPRLVNDLDFDGDWIYFVDSTHERPLHHFVESFMEARPAGRLFRYNEQTKTLEQLLENLYFPNGVQLGPNKDYLLINENTMARILKYHIRGEKKGQTEVFAVLPGFGDTLRLTEKGTILSPIAAARSPANPSLLDLLGKHPFVRKLLLQLLNLEYIALESGFLPKYGLLVEYDLNGKIIRSWHDTKGKVIKMNTNAVLFNNKIYLGSIVDDFIAVVDY